MSSKLVQNWFDGLEKVLAAEAELAGLLGHGTMIGNSREFFVSRVLRSFLPPSVHIGTGRVVDSEGKQSKQIDVVVYDPRFPMLGTESGGNIYFAEGVIAAIEVKSELGKKNLVESLDNCLSVMQLSLRGGDYKEFYVFERFLREEQDLPGDEAGQAAADQCSPFTYIFSYRSKLSYRYTCEVVGDWYKSNGQQIAKRHVLLPRIIATGSCAALTLDAWFRVDEIEPVKSEREKRFGENSRTVMEVYETERRFGWLAAHLMSVVSRRLGSKNHIVNISYNMNPYFPLEEYRTNTKRPCCIVWTDIGVK